MVEKRGCSICCFFFSLSGVVFCFLIAYLLEKQPTYIKGIEEEHIDDAKSALFESGYIYTGIMGICAVVWALENRKLGAEQTRSSDIPDERTALLSSHY